MYKCLECGQNYKEKPDFCDCGNDTFEEIISNEVKNIFRNDTVAKEPEVSTIELTYKKNMPSIIFFIFCVVLSFIILFFIANPKDEPKKQQENKTETVKNIPDINQLWDDTKAKQNTVQKLVKQAQTVKEEPKTIPAPAPKMTKVELKKEPAKITAPFAASFKPVQKLQTKKQQPQNNSVQTKKTAQQIKPQPTQAKSQIQQPIVQQVQTTTPQQTKPQTQNIQATPSQNINPEELKQYKKALRNKIASNIDFLNIAGDGKCVLSFNISQGGTLLNRKFVSQSQNTSLNDAVYQAMLQVSSFKTPPNGYKNETMKLTVKISGGNFEVSLE